MTLDNHTKYCFAINGTQAIKMPEKGEQVYFKNQHKQLPVPFVIYADFEAITQKVDSCLPSNQKSYTCTQTYQKHEAFGYKVVCHCDKQYSKPTVIYRGEDAINLFINKLFEEVQDCQNVMKEHFNKPLRLTHQQENSFKKATHCHVCERKLNPSEKENIPVRDHCHITGKYRGAAHKNCNLRFKLTPDKIKIPVIFHNIKGYDSHFIMQKLGQILKNNEDISVDVIPCNSEKYMAFYLGKHLTFIDSFQFMSQSLYKLSANPPRDQFIYTDEKFSSLRDIMKKKGVYPYDYMDSFSKFNETNLPNKEDFYSLLLDEPISDDQYRHAQNVWDAFQIKNLGEYHDLYLESDVLLLADVFENFRKTCLKHYKLDPCHYLTSPGLSWDAMLKMTEINLELISDIDMQLFVEKKRERWYLLHSS